MSKIVHYQCDFCKETYSSELKMGPINIEIYTSTCCYKRWPLFVHQEHVCSNCLEKLESAINELINNFIKVRKS